MIALGTIEIHGHGKGDLVGGLMKLRFHLLIGKGDDVFDHLCQHLIRLDGAPVQRDGAGHSALETVDAVGNRAGALGFRIQTHQLAALTAVKKRAGNAAACALLGRKKVIAASAQPGIGIHSLHAACKGSVIAKIQTDDHIFHSCFLRLNHLMATAYRPPSAKRLFRA